MTSKLDVAKAWTEVPSGDFEAEAAYLSDDFQFVDKDDNVLMNKETWIGMGQLLLASFENWDYVVTDLRQEGDFVIMTGHFQGKHTADLDLSAMGIGVIPASGKEIVWPDESSKITIEGDKIVRLEPHGDSGGMETFLAGLGVEQPSA
jgi:hypothetical protein